ncbi:hypothetical protein D0866_06818 [Hortaea werneckii]|nr:hypothetical protein D0866_06818 [Hortaea werneckii]
MKEYVEPDHAGNEDEDKEYLDVNSERSSIGYEGENSENEQDTESFLNQKSAVSLDKESPNSRLSDGQRAEYGLKAAERVEKSAQNSAPRKRKTSIDQEDGPSSQEKLPKRRKAQPKTDAEISLLKNGLMTHREKEEMQIKDYGEDQITEFEEVREKFEKCNEARSELGVSVCRAALGKHEVPVKRRKKSRSPVDCAASISGDTLPHKDNEGIPEQEESCSPGDQDKIENEAQDEAVTADNHHELFKKWKMPSGNYKPIALDKELVKALKKSLKTPPRFLYRASSSEGVKRTNGYDHITLHVPAAHMNDDEKCHESLYDIPNGLGELAEMLGHRFLWSDRRRDETLSWTSSLLFALVHASGRLAKGQRGVVIHVIDTTKVKTLDGRPIEFHFAPDLLRILDIQSYKCWDSFQLTNLRQPWFTHEWISHHVVKSPLIHSYEADISELIETGLYSFVSSLKTQEDDDMRSLYHRCCYSRSAEHSKDGGVRPFTITELIKARDLATCFTSSQTQMPGTEPPIFLLIDFLGLTARPKTDPVFIDWIRKRYNPGDLRKSAYENMTRVPNNTPELAQALDLARDACIALGVPQIPGTRVWVADADFNWYCKWLRSTWKQIKIRDRSKKVKLPSQKKESSSAPPTSVQGSTEDNDAAARKGEGSEMADSVLLLAGEEESGNVNQEKNLSGFPNGTEGFAPNGCLGMTPKYLFRVWSKQSHGTNTPTLFVPASGPISSNKPLEHFEITAQIIQDAFVGRPLPRCPFIFFTDSPIHAFQLAAKKKADGFGAMQITCIDTTSSWTLEGASVKFHPAKMIIDNYGAAMRTNYDGSAREYADEYITIYQSVKLGPGSATVAYDRLIQLGLFQLYPHLEAVNQRRRVMWYHSINDLRDYGFGPDRPIKELSKEKINIAVELAASFTPAVGNKENGAAPIHLIAAFLALQKRGLADHAILSFFESIQHSQITANVVAKQHPKHVSRPTFHTVTDPWIDSNGPLKSNKKRSATVIDLTEDKPSPAKRIKKEAIPVIDLTLEQEPVRSSSKVADARQYEDLVMALTGKHIRLQYPSERVQVNQSVLIAERSEWEVWHRQSREAYRAQKVYTHGRPRGYPVQREDRRGAERKLDRRGPDRRRRFDDGSTRRRRRYPVVSR